MNVLGHAYVAERTRPGDRAYILGAVLPDLASIAGVRLVTGTPRPRVSPAIADGVACHHAADATFHSLALFRTGTAAMRLELLDARLPTGAARAVAHVGYELVLDGTLVGTATEDAYRRAVADADMTTAAIAPGHRARWAGFVERINAHGRVAIRYDDVDWVAHRLVAILANRPRLRLDVAHVPAVARVLDRHVDAIRGHAPDVLTRTFVPRVGG